VDVPAIDVDVDVDCSVVAGAGAGSAPSDVHAPIATATSSGRAHLIRADLLSAGAALP
jgi:hypothetical protein